MLDREGREAQSLSQSKIITRLRERRQIEADLRNMLTAASDLEFRHRAQQIASLGSPAIPVLLSNLDQADRRMIAAIGTVATFLKHEDIVAALRSFLLQPERKEQGRLGAITILERFLGEAVSDDLRPSVAGVTSAALAALDGVLAEAEQAPAVLVEYVLGLDRQEPDVALAVIRQLLNFPGSKPVELLRMMAQDVREEIAEEALRALGSIRLPEAARALQALIPAGGPRLSSQAERLVRKLRFAGVEVDPLPAEAEQWRALISPVDGMGQRSVWFIGEDRWTARTRFLNLLLNDRVGVMEALSHEQVSLLMLPPRRQHGYVHDLALPDGSAAVLLLEAPFDTGRRLAVEALAYNRQTQIPVPGVLRYRWPWLFGYGRTELPTAALPQLSEEDTALVDTSDRLLGHPAFASWTLRTDPTLQSVVQALHLPGWDLELWVRRLSTELFSEPAVAQTLQRRLVDMSEWLFLAGDELWSKQALATAQAMAVAHAAELPFAQALVRRDLEWAIQRNGNSEIRSERKSA